MFRALVLIHRYVGIAVGLLMAVWCLSGVVMMYVPYPRLTEELRVGGLAEIDWRACCSFGSRDVIADDARVSSFQLEMLGVRPVLRVVLVGGERRVLDLRNGSVIESFGDEDASRAATRLARSMVVSGEPRSLGLILRDQWTVAYNRGERPIHALAFDDPARTVIYVSSTSGKVLQVTQSAQRFWNWLGSVPHWLYPTALRQHTAAWAQVVIWASVVGVFLTGTGLYLGIKELRRRNGRVTSPHRGIMYWHHVPGLIFGVLVLTWTLSGLFSMNPWGVMETQGVTEDMQALTGGPPKWIEVRGAIEALAFRAPTNVVSAVSAPFGGKLYSVLSLPSGRKARFDAAGELSPLRDEEVEAAVGRLQIGERRASWELLREEDAYHYSTHSSPVTLPVWRVVAVGAQPVRYYLDAVTGRLVNKVDSGSRSFRWWHSALHTFDFSSMTRAPWFRNTLMLTLLLGAALVTATGTWLGIRRLTR
jgi:uncharacterized iron-regulated membrane protein